MLYLRENNKTYSLKHFSKLWGISLHVDSRHCVEISTGWKDMWGMSAKLQPIRSWIMDRCSGDVYETFGCNKNYRRTYHFQNLQDATMFKLKWSGMSISVDYE